MNLLAWSLLALVSADPLPPGDHLCLLQVDGRARSYHVHVPPQYDPTRPTPVVLIFHGAATNGQIMASFCGLNTKADDAGFIAVYPNGTGVGGLLTFNAGGLQAHRGDAAPDDVKFTSRLLDELAGQVHVDPRRVYATGMSNGGMMCYRLAAELSDRIAAIAPVSGTMTGGDFKPARPVPVIHFHGTKDLLVPYEGRRMKSSKFLTFKSVDETIRTWARLNGCPEEPIVTDEPDLAADGTTVKCQTYAPGTGDAEVVLYSIEGGGHTWPGRPPRFTFIGKSTMDISANHLIWDFFQKHPLPAAGN